MQGGLLPDRQAVLLDASLYLPSRGQTNSLREGTTSLSFAVHNQCLSWRREHWRWETSICQMNEGGYDNNNNKILVGKSGFLLYVRTAEVSLGNLSLNLSLCILNGGNLVASNILDSEGEYKKRNHCHSNEARHLGICVNQVRLLR